MNGFYKLDNEVLKFDVMADQDKILFNHYIMQKENRQRLKGELPRGQFYLAQNIAAKDLNMSQPKINRLVADFKKLGIINVVQVFPRHMKKQSIYEYAAFKEKTPTEYQNPSIPNGLEVVGEYQSEVNRTEYQSEYQTEYQTEYQNPSIPNGLEVVGEYQSEHRTEYQSEYSKKELSKRIIKKNSLKDITTTNNKEEEKVVVEILNTQFAKCFNREVLPKYVEDLMGYMSKGITLELVLKIMEYSMSKNDPMAYCRRVIENSVSVCVYTVDAFEEKIKERAKLKVAQQPVPKNTRFTKIMSHNWDLNELERLEQEYIDKKLHGSGVADDKSF